MKKSDKLYILKENIEALFNDKQKQIYNECKEKNYKKIRYFEEFVQLFLDVAIITKKYIN